MMANEWRDQTSSLWDSGMDLLGWVTVLLLFAEFFWWHVADMTLVYTMLPLVAAMIGLQLFDLIFPHRCNAKCYDEHNAES